MGAKYDLLQLEDLVRKIKKTYLDWYNTDLPEKKEAPKTLYAIGELLKEYGVM